MADNTTNSEKVESLNRLSGDQGGRGLKKTRPDNLNWIKNIKLLKVFLWVVIFLLFGLFSYRVYGFYYISRAFNDVEELSDKIDKLNENFSSGAGVESEAIEEIKSDIESVESFLEESDICEPTESKIFAAVAVAQTDLCESTQEYISFILETSDLALAGDDTFDAKSELDDKFADVNSDFDQLYHAIDETSDKLLFVNKSD